MKNFGILVIILLAIGAGFFLFTRSNDSAQADSVVIKGSDTEVQLVSNLVEAFLAAHPGQNISVTGGGSGTGIAALLNGEIDVANSSRPLSEEEHTLAQTKGIDVREFILARDGLSVVVHPESAVAELTLDEIGKIYRGEITDWKDVGGEAGKIVLYGRQSTSGTYVFFRDTVVKGDYARGMLNMEGSQAIVDATAADTNGIGYVGVGYVKDGASGVRQGISVVLVANDAGSVAVSPLDTEKVVSGAYPIVRPIYQYIKELPKKGSAIEALLMFEASPEGHLILEETGFYVPISADEVQNTSLFDSIQ